VLLQAADARQRAAGVGHGDGDEDLVGARGVGDAHFAALPLEATTEVGLDWKRRIGSENAALLSIANGWLRYLPHPRDFSAAGAERHYEVLMSTFEAGAAARLLDEAERLDRRLGAELGR